MSNTLSYFPLNLCNGEEKKVYNGESWMGRSVYMEDLYVTPDYRGQGLGKLLWKTCVQVKPNLT